MTNRIEVRGTPLAYALLGVESLPAIDEAWRARLSSPEVTANEVFRSYIGEARALRPAGFEWARALAVAAFFVPGRLVGLEGSEGRFEVLLPPNYYVGGLTRAEVRDALAAGLGGRVERAGLLPLKTLAAWSGLGRYGRNNILYVEGMGTSIVLSAFWAEAPGAEIPPPPGPAFLGRCASCRLCEGACPTGAIPPEPGCIDAGRCLSLFNEIEGEFPSWLAPDSHNALIGCGRCQLACPEDAPFRAGLVPHGPFGRRETELILAGAEGAEADAALARLLSTEDAETLAAHRPVLSRNLRAFMEARRLRAQAGRADSNSNSNSNMLTKPSWGVAASSAAKESAR